MVNQAQRRETGLGEYADRYFEVLAAGGPELLPVAPGAVFTENGQVLQLGRGLWRTATGVGATRAVTLADEESGEVATWGMVSEAGRDAILGVRLKVDAELIAEIETFVVRINDMVSGFGLLDAERLARPTPGLLDLLAEADRPTRDELRRAADGYLDGVSGDNADLIPVADDCIRVENGVQTVLRTEGWPPGTELQPRQAIGVAQQVREGLTRHIWAARDRGMYLTDPERGLVMVRFFFDHPGKVHGWQGRAPFIAPNSMPAWEVFKVRGGLIRHIEAIISVFPYGMRWGWLWRSRERGCTTCSTATTQPWGPAIPGGCRWQPTRGSPKTARNSRSVPGCGRRRPARRRTARSSWLTRLRVRWPAGA